MRIEDFDGWAAKAWNACVDAGNWLAYQWKGAAIVAFVAFLAGRWL